MICIVQKATSFSSLLSIPPFCLPMLFTRKLWNPSWCTSSFSLPWVQANFCKEPLFPLSPSSPVIWVVYEHTTLLPAKYLDLFCCVFCSFFQLVSVFRYDFHRVHTSTSKLIFRTISMHLKTMASHLLFFFSLISYLIGTLQHKFDRRYLIKTVSFKLGWKTFTLI